MKSTTPFVAALTCAGMLLGASPLAAHDTENQTAQTEPGGALPPLRADGHAPIGVMGDHRHKTGEVMLSYRFMHMDMRGSRMGTSGISPTGIATTVPNTFAGLPGQPPTLRVVPTDMQMDMHMFGAMYAPTNTVTLMAMLPWIDKSMHHLTFAGGAGTTVLGGFRTHSSGFGDLKVTALIKLMQQGHSKLHFNFGVSLPTGSTTEKGTILTPTGATPNVRLPYAMQLGSGTYDLLPGLTYTNRHGDTGWGAQLTGVVRTGHNHGYRLGNEVALTTWVNRQIAPWISVSGRIEARSIGDIHGRDPAIVGPVQTADPANYGGNTVTLYAGVNLMGQQGALRGHRLALEAGLPIYRDLNGPQLETDWTVTLGWQLAL